MATLKGHEIRPWIRHNKNGEIEFEENFIDNKIVEKRIKSPPDTAITDIDRYIRTFPKGIRESLHQIRKTIREAAKDAEEVIKYGMPTYVLNGNLVHFAAYKNHIGFYPDSSGIAAFRKELSVYKGAKGSVQFSHDKPLPLDLISKIVKFRVNENLETAVKKKSLQVKKIVR